MPRFMIDTVLEDVKMSRNFEWRIKTLKIIQSMITILLLALIVNSLLNKLHQKPGEHVPNL